MNPGSKYYLRASLVSFFASLYSCEMCSFPFQEKVFPKSVALPSHLGF